MPRETFSQTLGASRASVAIERRQEVESLGAMYEAANHPLVVLLDRPSFRQIRSGARPFDAQSSIDPTSGFTLGCEPAAHHPGAVLGLGTECSLDLPQVRAPVALRRSSRSPRCIRHRMFVRRAAWRAGERGLYRRSCLEALKAERNQR